MICLRWRSCLGSFLGILILGCAGCVSGGESRDPEEPVAEIQVRGSISEGKGEDGPPPLDLEGFHQILSNDQTYSIAYSTEDSLIPVNEMFSLRVYVMEPDSGGRAMDGITLSMDARMPDHRHGMNTLPRVESSEDGGFEVSGMMFHMPGRWELTFDVNRRGITERAQVDVHLE